MIRNIYTENIIDLTSLHRLSQYLLGTVIVIGCWQHVNSKLMALVLLFLLLIYQTVILLLTFNQRIQLYKKKWYGLIIIFDGIICGITIVFCHTNSALALGVFALFLLIYIQTLGIRSLYAMTSLAGTVLIINNSVVQSYEFFNFCQLTKLCEHMIFIILFVFLIIYSCLKSLYDHNLNHNLAQQFNKNRLLRSHIFSLSKYLSPELSKSIITGHEVRVESSEKPMTIFFSDMTGFCKLSEQHTDEQLIWLINSYIKEMSDIIFRFGGTLDKVIGDSIMVFFGDPRSRGEKEDALACVSMAIEMNKAMQKLRRQWIKSGINNPPNHRIGINSGHCKVGNFGTDAKLDYTVMGNAVNLASYLESVANTNEILLSEKTYQLVHDRIRCKKKAANPIWLAKSLELYAVY
jgi:adenylate cyclase